MAICVSCPERAPSVSLAQFKILMRLPPTCELAADEASEITRALLRADAEFARYAQYWPAPTRVCEEHDLYFKNNRCRFACGDTRGRLVLKYGKVERIEEVEFLQRGSQMVTCADGPSGECWTVSQAALCVLDGDYGLVELARWQASDCVNYNLDRIRIHYTSGDCGFPDLLAPFAATFLPFPVLCGVDMRRDAWDRWTLTDTEHKVEDKKVDEQMREGISRSGTTAANNWNQGTDRDTTTTTHDVIDDTKVKEYRREPDKRDWHCPWGLQPAQLNLWHFLKGRRRLQAIRV
ncbi:hypothetical protein BH10CHL1_BH10CHL1_06550 [soil metagenome]